MEASAARSFEILISSPHHSFCRAAPEGERKSVRVVRGVGNSGERGGIVIPLAQAAVASRVRAIDVAEPEELYETKEYSIYTVYRALPRYLLNVVAERS